MCATLWIGLLLLTASRTCRMVGDLDVLADLDLDFWCHVDLRWPELTCRKVSFYILCDTFQAVGL